MFYSKMTGGFYDPSIHGENIPLDAVEISGEYHVFLLDGQSSGQRIIGDDTGMPILADQLPTTAEEVREAAKRVRAKSVSAIVVTTQSGKSFDGDEVSQGRMARAVVGMDDDDSIEWVLSDNTVTSVSKSELREALRLAGAAQSAMWVIE